MYCDKKPISGSQGTEVRNWVNFLAVMDRVSILIVVMDSWMYICQIHTLHVQFILYQWMLNEAFKEICRVQLKQYLKKIYIFLCYIRK